MATVHTTARGTEPYDKVYCLGYQVHHEDWPPYPRINKLRQTFLDRGYDVDVERLRLVTESYQQHEHLPEKLKVAYAFENVLLHCGIEIYDDDLIVGEIASPVKSAPIYPEFSVNWILDEVQNHPFEEREHDQFYIRNEKEKQEILDLCSWWKGRTLDDYINVRLDDDQLKGSEAGKKIYQTNLYHYAGTGHLAVDYARLMRLGFDGLLERAKQKLAALDMHDPEFCTKREFYQAVIIMHSAVKKYIERYANRVPASAALVQAVQNAQTAPAAGETPEAAGPYAPLMKAVEKGLKGEAAAQTRALLETKEALELVDEALIPALDIVGNKYEKGTLYLPQLLQAPRPPFPVKEQDASERRAQELPHGAAARPRSHQAPESRGGLPPSPSPCAGRLPGPFFQEPPGAYRDNAEPWGAESQEPDSRAGDTRPPARRADCARSSWF